MVWYKLVNVHGPNTQNKLENVHFILESLQKMHRKNCQAKIICKEGTNFI